MTVATPADPAGVVPVERVVLHRIRIPFRTPFVTAHGVETDKHATIVEVLAAGTTGWGECSALEHPSYTYEYADGAFAVLRDHLVPDLLAGRATAVVGHPMAKASIEAAVLDARLRSGGRSLAEHLGATRVSVPAGVAVGLAGSAAELVDSVARRVDEGYRRVKLKIEPGRDVEPVAAVRQAFPDLELHVDANGAYRLGDAALLQRFDGLDLALIEQPLDADDLEGHAALARQLRTPICLDESITSARTCGIALSMGACSVVNLKAARVGGLGEALRVHATCVERSAGLWCGGMLETGIGRAMNLALAALPGFTLTGDLSATSRYFARDLTEPIELIDGQLRVPSGHGIGVEVDREFLAACTLTRA
jgi:O-succinylbenzoate synthase